jgi:hypothetical protein
LNLNQDGMILLVCLVLLLMSRWLFLYDESYRPTTNDVIASPSSNDERFANVTLNCLPT